MNLFKIFAFIMSLLLVFGLKIHAAEAGILTDRIQQFPDWINKPPIQLSEGDLNYPNWMQGTWEVTSTLVDLAAPLAPEIVTPGFENNRESLQKPVKFLVRFDYPRYLGKRKGLIFPLTSLKAELPLVPDREFNGLSIASAYLGPTAVVSVKVDPEFPDRQITTFQGDRQLVSIVTGRNSETPSQDDFIATEIANQIFRGAPQLYFNIVETTTAYHRESLKNQDLKDQSLKNQSLKIEADQITAVYLSPQDANYFKALDRPVALYRYHLELLPVEPKAIKQSPTDSEVF